jgi:hypothetical protein
VMEIITGAITTKNHVTSKQTAFINY